MRTYPRARVRHIPAGWIIELMLSSRDVGTRQLHTWKTMHQACGKAALIVENRRQILAVTK